MMLHRKVYLIDQRPQTDSNAKVPYIQGPDTMKNTEDYADQKAESSFFMPGSTVQISTLSEQSESFLFR